MKDIVYVKLVTRTKFNNKNTAKVNTTITLKKSSNKKKKRTVKTWNLATFKKLKYSKTLL